VELNDQFELDKVKLAFSDCSRPTFIRNPNHCEECLEAEKYLENLDPSDLILEDIEDCSGFDYFSMITDAGYLYFLPALCRLALERKERGLNYLILRTCKTHITAILHFLDYLNCMNYLSNSQRSELNAITEKLHSISFNK